MDLNKKGEVTIISVFILFVSLCLYVAFLPTIDSMITQAIPYLESNVMALWLIKLIPMFFLVGIVIKAFRSEPAR